MNIKKLAGIAFVAVLLAGPVGRAADELERGFLNPPDSAKPHAYWFWMNGSLSKEGITADLESLKAVGIGGALIMEANVSTPPGPVKYMGEEWWQMTRHAIAEAHRLGLELNLSNCAGWSSSGGPWITPEQAMQQVVTSEVMVQGPAHASTVLPRPQRPQVRRDYYRDIAVLAFPTPQGESDQMRAHAPKITASSPDFDATKVTDGDPKTDTVLPVPRGKSERPYVQIEFAEPFSARTLSISGIIPVHDPCEVQISQDGRSFKTLNYFSLSGWKAVNHLALSAGTAPVTARYFRVLFKRHENIRLAEISLSERLSVPNFDSKAAYLHVGGCLYTSLEKRPVRADSVSDSAGQSAPGFAVPRDGVIDLTQCLLPDGRLEWDAPEGQWTILRIGHIAGGNINHEGPAGSRGLECDKMSKSAAEALWAGLMQKVINEVGPLAGKTLVATHIDSWEVGSQNWTAAFPEEFRKRRGYDLMRFLPVFSNRIVESPEVTERFLWDLRRTIGELFAENYYQHFSEMARRSGLSLQAQTYGAGPIDELGSAGIADIPMAEFWRSTYSGQGEPSCKLAASGAHAHGRNIISAESYSGLNHTFMENPFQLKAFGDTSFSRGINRFVFCSYPHQPFKDLKPGMTIGNWSNVAHRNNTWWQQSSEWMRYLARCQFLLQQGTFAADVCFFGGEDYLAGYMMGSTFFRMGSTSPLPQGYDHDLLDRDMLLGKMQFEDGFFVLPSGMRYRYLVLPDSKALSLAVVKKVRDLVAAGGTVIGPRPEFSPTLEGYPACENEIRKIAGEVWGQCDGKSVMENRYGKGRIIWGKSYEQVFAEDQLVADFGFKSAAKKGRLNYIHRGSKEADWYFVCNLEETPMEAVCSFRVTGKQPEFWYPDTGRIEKAAWYRVENGQTFVPMRFDACGSAFVVFRSAIKDDIVSVTHNGKAIAYEKGENPPEFSLAEGHSGVELTAFTSGSYEFVTASGEKSEATIALPAPRTLEGPWEVSFDPQWFYPDHGSGGKMRFDQLSDWSKRQEAAVKYFSGTAVYEKEFVGPPNQENGLLYLDLGEVEVMAEVDLNGKNLGVIWKPPFRVDITEAVKAGEKNRLVVKVTNLWPNRLIGDEHLPADCDYKPDGALKDWPEWLTKNQPRSSGRRTFMTWRYWKSTDPLLPSGLLGPVRLVPVAVTVVNSGLAPNRAVAVDPAASRLKMKSR